MPRGRRTYDSAIRSGFGFAMSVLLARAGTLAASGSAILDIFQVPAHWGTDKDGAAFVLGELFLFLGSKGSTSGSTTVKVIKNGDVTNGIIGTLTIAYNATDAFLKLDLRDALGNAPLLAKLAPGDQIGLLITAVPGTASANCSVRCSGKAYDPAL